MQSWQVVQPLQSGEALLSIVGALDANMGQSAGMLACISVSNWPATLVDCALLATILIAFSSWAAMATVITSAAQPRTGRTATRKTSNKWRMAIVDSLVQQKFREIRLRQPQHPDCLPLI